MGLTTEELAYNIILASKSGNALPLRLSLTGIEYVLLYNPDTKRIERVLVDQFDNNAQAQIDALALQLDGKEDKTNKANTFDIVNTTLYPTIKAVTDYITSLRGATDGLASLDSNGTIPTTQLPDLAITSTITPTETTIADFATDSANYTFQQGDVIIIDDNGSLTHYLYKGGTKTDVNEYSQLTTSEIAISQVIGLQTALDNLTTSLSGYLPLTGGTVTGEVTFDDHITVNDKNLSMGNGFIQGTRFVNGGYDSYSISYDAIKVNRGDNSNVVSVENDGIRFNSVTSGGSGEYSGIKGVTLSLGTTASQMLGGERFDVIIPQKNGTVALLEDIPDIIYVQDNEFQDGFENYATTTTDWLKLNYYKQGNNVFLQGFIKGGITNGTILTLPAGYRVNNKQLVFAFKSDGSALRIDVETDGTVSVNGDPGFFWTSINVRILINS